MSIGKCFPVVLALLCSPALAAPTTQVIPLGYGLAENIVPLIEPILEQDERVSAYGNQLVIRAEPARIDEIRSLIVELDKQPTRLLISVASDDQLRSQQRGYAVNGRIESDPVDIVVGKGGDGNRGRIIRRSTSEASAGVRQVMANEGYPVIIQRGASVPLTSTSVNQYGQVVQQTQYRDVTQGFYATVRLSGDMATIQLSTNNDQLNRNDGKVIDIQRSDTVVTAPLGEWVTVGGINAAGEAEGRDIGRRIRTRTADQGSIRLKVERLN